jgi:uncharacterized OB-fold protein
MSERPTVEEYKQNITDENFKAFKCIDCGAVIAPPSGTCYACGSNKMEWTDVSGNGKLVSFTVIHIAPEEFQEEAPYYVGIVELQEGTRVTSRLGGYDPEHPEQVKLDTPVKLGYEKGKSGKTYLCFSPK